MHSSNLQLKNTVFFKLEIQEKVMEMVGMLPLEETLPINGSFIEEMLREENIEDSEEDQYEDQVEYFVVWTDRLIKKQVEKTICSQLGRLSGRDIIIKTQPWKGQQKLQTLYLSIETNRQTATITVYKFDIDANNLAYTLYPTTASLDDLLSQFACKITNTLLIMATKYEYSGMKIVSILCQKALITVCLQLGQIFIYGRISITQQAIKYPINHSFIQVHENELKQRIIVSIINNLGEQPEDIHFNAMNEEERYLRFVKDEKFLTQYLKLLDYRKQVVLAHQLYQHFCITLQSSKNCRSNTNIFSAAKQKLYIRNIIQLVSQGLQSTNPEIQELRPYLVKIAKQSDSRQIIATFNSLCKHILAKLPKSMQNRLSNDL